MAQELADRRPVRVEGEISREILGCGCVERNLARLHELHHLRRDDRLRSAADTELAVGLHVVDPVRLPHGAAPRPSGGHHGGGHSAATGSVGKGRLELHCYICWDWVVAESCEGLCREWSWPNRRRRSRTFGDGNRWGDGDVRRARSLRCCQPGAAATSHDPDDE